MWNDIRFACRLLLKNPGFTAVAALTLALGIGATTTVFCWIQSVLLRPFPGATEPGRLVVLCSSHGSTVWDTVSYPDIKDYATLKEVFAGIIGSQVTPGCLSVDGKLEWIYGQIATANFFDVLGVRPQLGRFFLPEEELRPGGAPVLVLSHGFWQRRFGGDPRVVGRSVELNRRPFTIVGVAPSEFRGTMNGLSCDFWAPLVMHEQVANFGSLTERRDRWLHTQARLQNGISLKQAQAAVSTMARRLEAAYPKEDREIDLRVFAPWRSPYGGQAFFLPVLSVLLAVSVAVLLIVAANVANLLLARAIGRQREMAIRLAMGIKTGRLVRQLLTESLLLAFLGGVLGMLFAHWAANLFAYFTPTTYLPIGYNFRVNLQTLGFTLSLTLATGVLFGLAPAVQAIRTNLSDTLKEGGRTSGSGTPHVRLRAALVVSEVALALMLLVGAGLCIKGLQRARGTDPGFDPRQTLLAGLRIGASGYNEETGKVFYRQLRERLASLPGVKGAALASWFPLGFEGGPATSVNAEGYQRAPNEDVTVPYSIISPHYFDTMGIPLLEGRDFTDRDNTNSEPVVIINETAARRFWPDQRALGRKVVLLGQRTATVVGIVKSGKYRSLSEPPKPFVYLPYQQGVWDLNLGVVLRTTGTPLSFAGALRNEVHALDSGVEVWALLSTKDFIRAAFLAQEIAVTLLVVLGGMGLVLAAMGLYGVMAFVVGQRTHEIGIRMALGAQTRDVLALVMRQGMLLTLLGLGVGLAGAVAITRLLASFLYGVSPFDPATFSGVALVLTLVTFVASFVPAARAARVDPMEALRYE